MNMFRLLSECGQAPDEGFLSQYVRHIEGADVVETPAYGEKHHILPKCLFPSYAKDAWNIKRIKAEDHFIAHYLLFKAFPTCSKLAWAWKCLWRGRVFQPEFLAEYASAYATLMKRGIRHTPESNLKNSKAHTGKTHTAEARERMSDASRGKKKSCAHSEKIAAYNKIRPFSEETRTKISNGNKGKTISDETKRKMSLAHKGSKPRLGIKHSEETKKKIAAAVKLKRAAEKIQS